MKIQTLATAGLIMLAIGLSTLAYMTDQANAYQKHHQQELVQMYQDIRDARAEGAINHSTRPKLNEKAETLQHAIDGGEVTYDKLGTTQELFEADVRALNEAANQ